MEKVQGEGEGGAAGKSEMEEKAMADEVTVQGSAGGDDGQGSWVIRGEALYGLGLRPGGGCMDRDLYKEDCGRDLGE